MGFVPAHNVVRVDVVYTWQGEVCENVFHFQGDTTPEPADMTALGTAVQNWRLTNLRPLQSNACLLTKVKVQDLSVVSGLGIEQTLSPASQGSLTDPSLPNNCTIAVALKTGFSGRSFRGRSFHVGLTEILRTGNQITGTTQTSLITAYMALRGPFSVNNYVLGVLSTRFGGVPRLTGVFTPVNAVTVDLNLDSQRRRLPGHNRHH